MELPRILIEDVPEEILDAIYEKWRYAYEDGWDEYRLWDGCDLCEWLNNFEDGCRRCPLRTDNWCNNGSRWSKLHDNYDYSYFKVSVTRWEDRVKDFLIFLKPYCSENGDGT